MAGSASAPDPGGAARGESASAAWALALHHRSHDDEIALLRVAVSCALLAPSMHNTQPWRFRLRPGAVDLFADRTRGLPVVDPEDRELTISCGAALHHLLLALANLSLTTETIAFPDPDDGDHLATVNVSRPHETSADERLLFAQLTRRHTNRAPFDNRRPPPALVDLLGRAAERHQVTFQVLNAAAQRREFARLVVEADALQGSDRRFRRELAVWINAGRIRTLDGVPPPGFFSTGGQAGASTTITVTSIVENRLDVAAAAERILASSPIMAVLASGSDDPLAWLRSGMALSEVALRARAFDVWVSYLNQALEVDGYRGSVGALAGPAGAGTYPQLGLRLGYGPEPRPTPRRPLSEVLYLAPPERQGPPAGPAEPGDAAGSSRGTFGPGEDGEPR